MAGADNTDSEADQRLWDDGEWIGTYAFEPYVDGDKVVIGLGDFEVTLQPFASLKGEYPGGTTPDLEIEVTDEGAFGPLFKLSPTHAEFPQFSLKPQLRESELKAKEAGE